MKPKDTQRIADVLSPQKGLAAAHGRGFAVPRRLLMGRATTANDHVDATAHDRSLLPVKRTVIIPIEPKDAHEYGVPEVPAHDVIADSGPHSAEDSRVEVRKVQSPSASAPAPALPPEPSLSVGSPEVDMQSAAPISPADVAGQSPEIADPKVTVAARKSREEAAERERTLQEYIDSRRYFVPINTVARKRSIKISLGMTLLLFLLALVLIDLMIDSGMILLIQRIPHTHFFNVLNNN